MENIVNLREERDQFLLHIKESRFKYLLEQSALADSGLWETVQLWKMNDWPVAGLKSVY